MKQQRGIHISMPEPCSENWDAMSPTGCGRFCARCEKTVFDFSVLSDEQVVTLLRNKEGQSLCGNFDARQLDRLIPLPEPSQQHNLKGRIAAALLLLSTGLSSLTLRAQTKAATTQSGSNAAQPETKPIIIYGAIRDAATNEPLMRMAINAESLGTQYSDRYGRFSFTLPENFTAKVLTITAVYPPLSAPPGAHSEILSETIQFEPGRKEYTVQLFRYPAVNLDLENEAKVIVYGRKTIVRGEMQTTYVPTTSKPGLWQRFKNIFGTRNKAPHANR